MCGIEILEDPDVLVGLNSPDDAGVFRINNDLAIIQTVDFFTPIVDDPYWFGQIAAANAMSDVYAMGGVPKTAMNLVAFPVKDMEIEVLRQIIKGGLDKMTEAGVVLVGGHSVEDKELKYGLSVTGFIHPDRILTKKDLKAGDMLILTKPLGTGIINTAVKGGLASPEVIKRVTRLMATLNRDAARIMEGYPVHACTDITGFGLLGHLAEMISDMPLGIRLVNREIPVIAEAVEYAGMGLVPAGSYNNRQFSGCRVDFPASLDPVVQDILFDPQTSGGLLIGVDRNSAGDLLSELQEKGMRESAVIGKVTEDHEGRIVIE